MIANAVFLRCCKGLTIPLALLIPLLLPMTLKADRMPATVAPGAKLAELYAADGFYEGPTWDPGTERLYFTAFVKEGQRILRLDKPGKVTVWADQTEGINGTFRSREGRLLGAQAYGHRVVDYGFGASGPEGPKVLLEDKTLHQPNDICQAPNGDIYFSDPDFKERKSSGVYLLRDGKTRKVVDDMALPNGLITSLDGKTLYVGDSYLKHWRAYPIGEDGGVGPGRIFFDPATENKRDPDGMTVDERGNLYFTGRGGIWVVTSEGEGLGLIAVPEFCSNVTFGGADGKSLFLTCGGKVYSLAMQVRGSAH